ncbi:MAG: sugar ABC transporter permease [Anaerolineaceae bacterium]|nr:sugar ABC transporter permease [Anaerolineaceae bacterium]
MINDYSITLLWALGTIVFIVVSSLLVGFGAKRIAKTAKASIRKQNDIAAGYAFVSPWLIGFIIFVMIPMLTSLYWSFTRYRLPDPPQWVGLQNYIRLLTNDKDFTASLFNTLFLTLFGLPLQLIAALGLAQLLNRQAKGERIFRAAFYMPVILGLNSAVLLCWRLMLNANNGLVNTFLRWASELFPPFNWLMRIGIYVVEFVNAFFFGLQNKNFIMLEKIMAAGMPSPDRIPLWLQSPLWTKTSIVLLLVWSCGAMMLIYLAALYNVPKEFYEAAEVDGASPWQKFRYITLPIISPYTFYNLIVGTIASIQIFEQVYVLFRDTPTVAQSAYSVVYYLWRATFRFNEMGYGSAISWLLLLIIFVITLIQFKAQSKWVTYDLK